MRNSAKVFQTKLFLSSCSRRLYEEMAATQRVPHDWENFIAGNFNEEGRPMLDRDAWGRPFQFIDSGKEVLISSAGPDRTYDTSDDISIGVEKPAGTSSAR